jgi:hypothetical protein
MTEPIQKLNLLDTQYADILANSSSPAFELRLVELGTDSTEARTKTDFITFLKRKPQTSEEWQELMDAWEAACGYRPDAKQLSLISAMLWDEKHEEE